MSHYSHSDLSSSGRPAGMREEKKIVREHICTSCKYMSSAMAVVNRHDYQRVMHVYNGGPVHVLINAPHKRPPVELGFGSWLDCYCALTGVLSSDIRCCMSDCASSRGTTDDARDDHIIGVRVRYCDAYGHWNNEYVVPLCARCYVSARCLMLPRVFTLLDGTLMIRANKSVIVRECRRVYERYLSDEVARDVTCA